MEGIRRNGKQVSQGIADYSNGRDEMNLVEFPLALLSERAPDGLLTLECTDEIEERGVAIKRQVTVAATAKFGLPTAKDEDVLMGMLQLAKIQNEFTSPVVQFTRLQLIRLLGWENTRWSYDRIALALERWRSVTVTYRKAWRDNKDREWTDRTGFGLIDSYNLKDSRRVNRAGGEGTELPIDSFSWFRWNGFIYDSFQSGYLKKLNYRVYRSLDQQAAKRLYRYLDKHFFEPHRLRLDFDLHTLAFEHLGMSRRYDTTQIRRALQPAVEELEGIGFIEKQPVDSRYKKLGRGRWRVSFAKMIVDRRTPAPAVRIKAGPRGAVTKDCSRERQRESEWRRVREYLDSLAPEALRQLEQDAVSSAPSFLRQNYEAKRNEGGPLFEECRKLIFRSFVLRILNG